MPGASQLYNNHLPVDPTLTGVVTISKTTPMVNVTRGQMVPYVISVKNTWEFPLTDVDVVDRYPVGFKYVEGSARFDDQPLEPTVADGRLVWSRLTLAAKGEHTIKLLLAPGAGVTEGKFTNFAHAQHNLTGQALSGQASATVRIVPDPTFDCTDVTGKVFDDHNRNGVQERRRGGDRGCATRIADGSRGANGLVRPLPYHVRDHAARRSRQQLHAEARQPFVADRLSRID